MNFLNLSCSSDFTTKNVVQENLYSKEKTYLDSERFGFNGQMKMNEIAGVGNHYTAEFWEYDTRLGRRWNMDPVVKSWRSSYDAFDNSPIWKIDPNGDDDFYNRHGKYIGSYGKGKALRVMDDLKVQGKQTFIFALVNSKNPIKSISKRFPSSDNFMNRSREITFKNEGETFKRMRMGAEKDNRERGTYLIFDAKNAEVRTLDNGIGEKGSDDVYLPFHTGSNVFSKEDHEITILNIGHTHQQEKNIGKWDIRIRICLIRNIEKVFPALMEIKLKVVKRIVIP